MSMKTEGDIPGLFRQFSGNSANYQELTRAAAARASQARWPLLSAVELERGDIPAVGESVAEPVDTAPGLAPHSEVRPSRGMTRLAGAIAPAPSARPDADDVEDDIATPAPVVLPGNTIFMAPAPHTARHFAQIERTLAQRRDAAIAEMAAPAPLPAEDAPALDTGLIAAATLPTLSDVIVAATLPTLSDVIVDTPVHADAPAPVSELAAPAALPEIAVTGVPTLSDTAIAPARHAGLKPLFDRLAGNTQDKASVDSLFSRLMRS